MYIQCLSKLGGFRKEGYQIFSQTKEFSDYIKELQKEVIGKNAVILCAEILWRRCHRKYIAETLSNKGYQVIHIFDKNKIEEHISGKKEIEEKMKVKILCDKKGNKL